MVELDREKSWELNVDAVRAAVRSNTKLIVVNFPHNPTGAMINVAQQDELIEIARKQGAYLFSDEVYRFLEHDEANTLPPMAAQYERGVSLSVLSKVYGLAGLRIGWLVCQDESLLDQLMEQKYYTSICNSAPSEYLSLMALRAKDHILKRNRSLIRDNLEVMTQFFEQHQNHFQWYRPNAGCIAFPRYIGKGSVDSFADTVLAKANVLLLPGYVFGDDYAEHFRISFARSTMGDGLDALTEFLSRENSARTCWMASAPRFVAIVGLLNPVVVVVIAIHPRIPLS